jgi:hypothetical protein
LLFFEFDLFFDFRDVSELIFLTFGAFFGVDIFRIKWIWIESEAHFQNRNFSFFSEINSET